MKSEVRNDGSVDSVERIQKTKVKVAYGEIVSKQLHDLSTILVAFFANVVQLCHRLFERLQGTSFGVRGQRSSGSTYNGMSKSYNAM